MMWLERFGGPLLRRWRRPSEAETGGGVTAFPPATSADSASCFAGQPTPAVTARLGYPACEFPSAEQATLEALVDSLATCAFIVEILGPHHFRYGALNRQMRAALGAIRKPANSTGDIAFPRELASAIEIDLDRCVRSGSAVARDAFIALPSGRRCWRMMLSPVRDQAGRISRILVTAIDITDIKDAEEAVAKREKRLVDAIEAIDVGFALWDDSGRLVLCNSSFRDLHPTIARQLRCGVFLEEVLSAGAASGPSPVGGRPEQGANPRVDGRLLIRGAQEECLKDGRWILATERRTDDGGIVCLRTDITERKQAEQAVRQSRATLQVMIDSVDEMIAMVSGDGVILAVNRAGASSLGLPPNRVVGRSVNELLPQREARHVQRILAQVLQQGRRRQVEIQWRQKCLDVSLHPVLDGSGHPTAISVFSRDISERKGIEETLRTLTRAVEQSPTVVIITDPQGTIEYVNPRFTS